jgi:RNA polymerase sigma-54 factor
MAQGLFLSQKLALQQVLAPQLQQSLALLQAPTLELRALVEQELAQNPLLEETAASEASSAETETTPQETADLDPAEPPSDVTFDPAVERPNAEPVDDFQAEFERLAQVDQEWRDHFSQTNLPMRQREEAEEKRQFMFDSMVARRSLQDDLLEQLQIADLSAEGMAIAEQITGNLDERGYLASAVEEIAQACSAPAERVLEVLRRVQALEPAGIAARDLRECLLLQLEREGQAESLEYQVVQEHLEALQKRRFADIARALKVYVDEIQDAAENIGKLNPHPGRGAAEEPDEYVFPEVFVQRSGDDYVVTTNNDHVPHLRISNTYKDLMANAGSSTEVRDYIRDKIRAGKFFIKSIEHEIVKRQCEFLQHGVAHLKPLTMNQVAETVGVHETTVSRAVSGKYIATPQGVFEMKYFFTSGVQTANGEGMSNTSVKDVIAGMLKDEDLKAPLSDDEIAKRLHQQGIMIARRTVAKYRSELNILPSNLRRVI